MSGPEGSSSLVSLIMPVWQPRRDWLVAAVVSALAQRDCRLELIVVDDGCPEPVANLLTLIRDQRLRVIRIEHAGSDAARNAGILHARGDRIRFVDSDDVLPPDSTRHLGSFMDGDGVIGYGATMNCDEELRLGSLIASDLQGDVVAECLLGRFDTRLPALLFPRRVVEAAGPWAPGFRINGDWDFVLRALEHARVRGDRTVVLHYRRHPQSKTGTADIAAGEEAWRQLIARYFARHPEQSGTRLERRAWAAVDLSKGCAYRHAGHYREAFHRLVRALPRNPRAGARELVLLAVRPARLAVPRRVREFMRGWNAGRHERIRGLSPGASRNAGSGLSQQ
jgi:glycosyltransferase involved in cell wall biosynthesis